MRNRRQDKRIRPDSCLNIELGRTRAMPVLRLKIGVYPGANHCGAGPQAPCPGCLKDKMARHCMAGCFPLRRCRYDGRKKNGMWRLSLRHAWPARGRAVTTICTLLEGLRQHFRASGHSKSRWPGSGRIRTASRHVEIRVAGMVNVQHAPPSSALVRLTRPPHSSTMSRQTNKPSPVPSPTSLVV